MNILAHNILDLILVKSIQKYHFTLIFIFVMLAFSGATSLSPILPSIIYIGGKTLHPYVYGYLIAAFPLGQSIGAMLVSHIADKCNIARTLIITSIVATIAACLCGVALIAKSYLLACFFRFISGIFEGSIVLARNLVLSFSQGSHLRNKRLGLISFAVTCGFLFGPLINGHLYMVNFFMGIFFPSFCAALTIISAVGILKVERNFHFTQKVNKIADFQQIGKDKKSQNVPYSIMSYAKLWMTCLSIYLAVDIFYQYVPLFLRLKFNFSASQTANMLLLIALSNGVTSLLSHIPHRYLSYKKILIAVSFSFIINTLSIDFITTKFMLVVFFIQGCLISILSNNFIYFLAELKASHNPHYFNYNKLMEHALSSRAFISGLTALCAVLLSNLNISLPFYFSIICIISFVFSIKMFWE